MDMPMGRRVKVGSHVGTIRFFGTVAETGEWYGVEWDDPTRGKHNGTYKEQRIFETKSDLPTCASFIKPRKVSWGSDIATSIEQRYTSGSHLGNDATLHGVNIELVGEAKVQTQLQQLTELQEAVLNSCDVNDSVPLNLNDQFPALRALDLSSCLLSSWTAVVNICRQLPRLESLILSDNRLDGFDAVAKEDLSAAFGGLTRLLLCKMPLSIDHVASLLQHTPRLSELHLCELEWTSLRPLASLKLSLKLNMLNLYGNNIKSWPEVFSTVRALDVKTLLINQNQLADFADEDVPEELPWTALSIGGNQLSSWRCVWQLGRFKGLTGIKLRNNRLGSGLKESELRKCVLVNLPHVTMLNGSGVSARERLVAERFYLTQFAMLGQTLSADNFDKLHPAYKDLVAKHGAVETPQQLRHDSLRQRLVPLTVKHKDTSAELRVSKDHTIRQVLRTACLQLRLAPPYNQYKLVRDTETLEGLMKTIHYHDIKRSEVLELQSAC
eukprot:TRINITY_DN12472_c0_g3_i7.p1 TRINITY_DN12472_c0_g3~~TRINITY_DN12472_c0_g3_i7.p1  ORF type:complete len:497 (+),score=116.34 TRINITY_DN12472_c0_g3_i7:85-1575(+)